MKLSQRIYFAFQIIAARDEAALNALLKAARTRQHQAVDSDPETTRLRAWLAEQQEPFTLQEATKAAMQTDDRGVLLHAELPIGLRLNFLGCKKQRRRLPYQTGLTLVYLPPHIVKNCSPRVLRQRGWK